MNDGVCGVFDVECGVGGMCVCGGGGMVECGARRRRERARGDVRDVECGGVCEVCG